MKKKSTIEKIISIIFVVSLVVEMGVVVGYAMLTNMDTNRFKNDYNINIYD